MHGIETIQLNQAVFDALKSMVMIGALGVATTLALVSVAKLGIALKVAKGSQAFDFWTVLSSVVIGIVVTVVLFLSLFTGQAWQSDLLAGLFGAGVGLAASGKFDLLNALTGMLGKMGPLA